MISPVELRRVSPPLCGVVWGVVIPVTRNRVGYPPSVTFRLALVPAIAIRGLVATGGLVVGPMRVCSPSRGIVIRGGFVFGKRRRLIVTVVDAVVLVTGKVDTVGGMVALCVVDRVLLGLIEGTCRRVSGTKRE